MKIACIGNATFDCTLSKEGFIIEDARNSFDNISFTPGGPASNAASVIAKFGSKVDFYSQLGNDVFGNFVYESLIAEGINVENISFSKAVHTPYSNVLINTLESTRTICTARSKVDYVSPKLEKFNYQTDYDFILTDGKYAEDSIELIRANLNAISIIDAGRANDNVISVCREVDYIICSQNFAEEVTGCVLTEDYQNNVMVYQKLCSLFPNAKGITITVGKRGYICAKDNEVLINSSYDSGLPAIDTNCAGDIFHGAFTYAIANGYDYYEALEFANVTASLSTTKTGGRNSCPNLSEVNKVMNNYSRKRIN
ncbi:MAG: carbohydrate kinase family protein [Bacilli bacterium]|nr:carbohydrate kinase family protein [Bacilli bacterium]